MVLVHFILVVFLLVCNLVYMKNRTLLSFLIAGILIVGVPSAISFAAKQNVETARVELSEPLNIDTFMNSVSEQTFDEMILESSFLFEGKEMYDFKIVKKGELNRDVVQNYIKDRKALIADVKGTKNISDEDTLNVENIKIRKATFTGARGNIDKVKKNLNIKKVDVTNEFIIRESQETPQPVELKESAFFFVTPVLAATTQVKPMYLSVPKSGTASIQNSTYAGERYSIQYMRWDANNFAPEQTYEHKLYLYNYDRKTFLNPASTAYPNCYPTVTYAATTWGSASQPYLDTRLSESLVGCEVDELSYTIGAAQANAITTNTEHYSYIRTANGNDSADKFKVQSQVGFRNPESCYSTWCSAKYKIYNVIPSWSTAPTSQTWTYNGQTPDAPSNVTVSDKTSSSLRINFTDNSYDETDVYVERQPSGGSYTSLGSFGMLNLASKWNWTNAGLQANKTYCYRLRAKNALGYSAYSNAVCATTAQ